MPMLGRSCECNVGEVPGLHRYAGERKQADLAETAGLGPCMCEVLCREERAQAAGEEMSLG
jgi:hypothetical protein